MELKHFGGLGSWPAACMASRRTDRRPDDGRDEKVRK